MNEAAKQEIPTDKTDDPNLKVFETIEGTIYNPARRWKRIVAALLDGVLLSILSVVVDTVFAFGVGKESIVGILVSFFLSMAISFIYYIVPTYKYQATPGKMLLGLKVMNIDESSDLGLSQVVFREALYKFIGALIFMIGYLYFFFNKDARALHDIWGKTIVVEEE